MSYKLSMLTAGNLPRLLEGAADEAGWARKKARIRTVWQQYIGKIPASVPTDINIRSTVQEKGHMRLHITYATGFGDRVPAYLLIPDCDPQPPGAFPAVLALHPTHAAGKADVATPDGRTSRQYGVELVSRGFVVLAPDTISAGERIYDGGDAFRTAPFYASYPESTAVGKMIHDHQQSLDVLTQLPYVDPGRIGAIGHSLGAYNAYFLAGADSRIKAVVSSCGFSPFTGDPDPDRWGQRDWFSHIPRLSSDIERDEVPFEWHEIAALCAPTPFFNWMGQKDAIFPHWQTLMQASFDLDQLYRLLNAEDSYIGLMGNAGHDFPDEIRAYAYSFLEKWLKKE